MADYDGYRTFTLKLFKDVKITRDYSTVHDLSPADWKTKLDGTPLLAQKTVNYYRVPSSIKVEMPYDDARKATYGYLADSGWNDDAEDEGMTFERPYFFWVDSVRLIRQGSRHGTYFGGGEFEWDVVELVIAPDVWSNCNGMWTLRDSQVVRKHMPRWDITKNSGIYSYSPKYYPSAADGTQGAYEPCYDAELTPEMGIGDSRFDLLMFVVTALDRDGVARYYIGGNLIVHDTNDPEQVVSRERILCSYDSVNHQATYMLSLEDILDGTFYTAADLSAEYVQSITVYPYLNYLAQILRPQLYDGVAFFEFNTANAEFTNYFAFASVTNGGETKWYISPRGGDLAKLMKPYDITLSQDVDGTDFPVPAKASSSGPYDTLQSYSQSWEPMLFRSPAMIRKFTDGIGGTVADIPDITAFEKDIRLQNMVEMTGSVCYVYTGDDIRKASQYGSLGEAGAATLPIYNSAWKSYEAISKIGDEIKYNAAQVNNVGGGIMNTILSGGSGFLMAGPAGAALGAVGGATSAVTSAYATAEDLRAKQTTIRNSPCTVQSSGSGIAAYVQGKIDLRYAVMKLDEQSYDRMALDYYRRGYTVDRFMSGDIDLHTRYLFDYIQTSRARVMGDVNAEEAVAIAGILDAGTTIWHKDGWPYIRDNTDSSGMPKYENMEIDS